MTVPVERVALGALLLLCVVGMPASVGGAVVPQAAAEERDTVETLTGEALFEFFVRRSYETLDSYIDKSQDVTFVIRDLRPFGMSEIANRPLTEFVTLREGLVLDLARINKLDPVAGMETVRYRAAWTAAALSWKDSQRSRLETVGGFLTASGVDPAEVGAVTRAEIEVAFDGNRRTYSALFLWLTAGIEPSWQDVRAVILDGIANRLGDVLVEPIPPGGRRIEEAERSAVTVPSTKLAPGQCLATSKTFNRTSGTQKSASGHLTGDHRGRIDYKYTCTCDTSCYQTCDTLITNNFCYDSGTPNLANAAHVAGASATEAGSAGQTAQCNVAFGCAIKGCLFGFCSATVTITGGGVTFTVTPPTGNLWFYHKTDNPGWPCPPCTVVPPPPPGAPPGGEWLTESEAEMWAPEEQFPDPQPGGGGGPGYCTFQCVSQWVVNNQVREYCWMTCSP
jgi:hypothetical protein